MFRWRWSAFVAVTACLLASSCSTGGCGFIFGVGQESSGQAANAAAAANPNAPPPRPKIVALGDSLTVGLGLAGDRVVPSLLQKKLDEEGYAFEMVNAGVSGDTSAGGLRRLDWALEGDVRVLIVALGANDGLRGLSIAEMKQNLTHDHHARAREEHRRHPRGHGGAAELRAGVRAVASAPRSATSRAREHVLLIPVPARQGRRSAGSLNQPDGIHPNAEGAQIIADTVWPVLRSVLDQMGTHS